MNILYVTQQGATLTKKGNRLVVEKMGEVIQWVHAFKMGQVVLMGNIRLTPAVITFLLEQGIDTVFLSLHGKYRGRLISELSKNIELRKTQFERLGDPAFALDLARRYVHGKVENCRILLRRHNRELQNEAIVEALNKLRVMVRRLGAGAGNEQLMGMEGASAAIYFGVLGQLLRAPEMPFNGRNRRPPRDPVNVLLSLGYTLLANAVQTQVYVTGLDPFLGALHSVEYGRPSLVLDLMEEFRPVLVDALVISLINRKIIRFTDFYRPEDREPAAFDFAETEPTREGYPILLTHEGMKKFITHFETRLGQRVLYLPKGQQLTYRDVLLEQVRLLVRHVQGEKRYEPFIMR
jgi:CRISP-associated protein Cas1